jgi:hypothetical protein
MFEIGVLRRIFGEGRSNRKLEKTTNEELHSLYC